MTVGGRPCNGWCRALTWCAAVHDGTSIRIEVVPDPKIQVHISTLTGKMLTLVVSPTWTVGKLKTLIEEHGILPSCEQRLIYAGRQLEDEKTLAECRVEDQSRLHLVLRLRGGKPVILFIPPSSGPHASTKSFVTTTSVTLHDGCHFTTLLPKPKHSVDGHSVTWNAIVERHPGPTSGHESTEATEPYERPAHVVVNGRKHSYLFWEFENDDKALTDSTNQVSRLVGYRSLLDHVDCCYLVKTMDEYEDWCDTVLGMLGLGVRERDDFATYWARMIEESVPFVILRVVPEADLSKCADLHVDACDGDTGDVVDVTIRRVYVTMLATHSLAGDLEEHKDRLCCDWHGPLPNELCDTFPIVKSPSSLMVIEWGGVLLTL